MSDMLPVLYRRILSVGDPALLQLGFHVAVLDRYRGESAYRLIRTDTVGRIMQQGIWTLDFGVSPGEATIHASYSALTAILPHDERQHWAMHAVPLPALSEMFLRMQFSPGSCFDDGELRPW